MANDLTTRPLKIDTAMGAVAAIGRSLRVKKVYWENPTTIAHTFQILDAGGSKVLLEGRCEVANQSQVFDFPDHETWKDFKVGTLSSGTIWIYTV